MKEKCEDRDEVLSLINRTSRSTQRGLATSYVLTDQITALGHILIAFIHFNFIYNYNHFHSSRFVILYHAKKIHMLVKHPFMLFFCFIARFFLPSSAIELILSTLKQQQPNSGHTSLNLIRTCGQMTSAWPPPFHIYSMWQFLSAVTSILVH